MLTRCSWAVLATVLVVADARGQEWARNMFQATSYDFGSVARGAKAEYSFVLTNDRAADVHVAGVRASCSCTTPRIEKEWLKSYEQGAIVAHLNSNNYLGHRAATITVTFDQPAYAEVQLQVRAFVHDNVLMEPSSVELGAVEQGQAAEGRVRLYRADFPNWQILGVQIADPQLSGQVIELARRGSEVWYDLRVRVAETAPPGYICEYAVLTTSDPSAAQIPVLVEGQVQSKVVVSPASLFLGVVRPGDKVTRQLVVRANTPFRITAIRGDTASLTLPQSDTAAKLLHLVPVTFVAGAEWGKVVKTIHIETDLAHAAVEASCYAVVAPEQ
ncbi:MAG: DUF1573 domain-containing protein [Thermoguttaceae bacterium]|jgi:hypothetical protein